MDLFQEERVLYGRGVTWVAGVDEVGRGCLAGPVYAGAVVLPQGLSLPKLRDSKKLSSLQRERLNEMILEQAIAAQVAWVSVEEIDRINIFQASLKAMRLAVEGLGQKPEMILVDGKFPLPLSIPQKPLVGGDDRSASIAAASIIAKVARDRFMEEQEKRFPHFSFSRHKGYGTALHLRELQGRGPTELHRRSFEPVRVLLAAAKDAHP